MPSSIGGGVPNMALAGALLARERMFGGDGVFGSDFVNTPLLPKLEA